MSTRRIVVASSNPGKLAELKRLLDPLGVDAVAQSEFDLPPAPEEAPTFIENALTKARAAARATGLPAIADDSGLEVDALGGAPGVQSARYAGSHGNDRANIERLLDELKAHPDATRRARFRCLAVFLEHSEHPAPLIAEGVWHGQIAAKPRGEGGFGYDPVFRIPEAGLTAAELTPEQKDLLSHRGQALTKLVAQLQQHLSEG